MLKNKELKRRIVEISYKLKLSHIGSCLTALPIIYEIYENRKPNEKVIISNGHCHLAHAIVMQHFGIIEDAEKVIQLFGIHCDRQAGCDVSTGSLGHGLPISLGIALSDRSKNVYCLISDGEMAEGSVWEALEVAYQNKLENLKIYINYNGWGAYRKIDADHFMNRIKSYLNGLHIQFYDTSKSGLFGWLDEQIAHYKVLNEKEYNEFMEILK